jgi:glycerate kinase
MKVVIAPDSFKGCLSASEVARAMGRGVRAALPSAVVTLVPMADGGEGTVRSLIAATNGRVLKRRVRGPLGTPVWAEFGLLGDGTTGVIEMAAASGLPLVPPERRNPLVTTTYGTGQLISAGLALGCRKFIVGIGGSATNDGGAGMAQALGARLLDPLGRELPPGGGALGRLARIDVSGMNPAAKKTEFLVACDVDNPLTGPRGASAVYGPQKGATPATVRTLDRNLRHFARVATRDLGKRVERVPGAGAAGGLGAGMMAFLDAELRPGVGIVMEAVGLRQKVRGAALVITGEGATDAQTAFGKTVAGVAQVAKEAGAVVVVLAGSLGKGYELSAEAGVDAFFSVASGPMSYAEALQRASSLLEECARNVALLFAATRTRRGKNKGK